MAVDERQRRREERVAALGDQGTRIRAIEKRERPGIFSLLLSDLLRNVYQTRWRRLATFPAWERPWVILTLILRFDTLWACWAYRWKRFYLNWHIPILPRVIDRFLAVMYQVQIGDHVYIGPGLYLPHGFVVMDGFVEIGRNPVISPYVTFGLRNSQAGGFSFIGPCAGDALWVGTHATLIGDIQLGDHVSIGANSLLIESLPSYCTAAGSPARIIRQFNREEIEELMLIQEIGYQGD
ncbi:MAG: hypothetical protein WEB00_10670 [Dehalococcoidia bacterium]